ncbi:unnamed protein product, partial [Effrenium voratum]
RLKYGFGFRAELRPSQRAQPRASASEQCCPDLAGWNSSTVAADFGSQLFAQGRRLATLFGGLGGGALPAEVAPLVDPFARENTGHQPPGHANRRPALEELMRQHDKRLGAHLSLVDGRWRERASQMRLAGESFGAVTTAMRSKATKCET